LAANFAGDASRSIAPEHDKLYSMTAKGGDNDMGTVFVIKTDGNGA
jgi:hypothetical protein